MRLERIEINGFKSFSDRSELAFDKGVTAIVGPNGCGKSNVADAITWVMGEQSAKSLRGERMEDIIFSGSDARKPTASAEVRLRFSGVVKGVTGPAFPADGKSRGRTATDTAAMTRRRTREWQWHDRQWPRSWPTETVSAEAADSVGRARGRGHAAALSVGRQRISDRRCVVPLAGRARAADGYRAWRQGLRHHRAGQDRPDSQLASDRSSSADRGSGRGHEVQVAAASRRTEARSGPAEPDSHRRHRVRGREAARHAEAPGGEGATISAAPRRAAAVGKSAVRAQVPPAGRRPSNRRAPGWPRHASARSALPRTGGRDRDGSRTAADRARRGRVARDRGARGGPCARARDQPPAAADRLRPRADSDARRADDRGSRASSTSLEARREPARPALAARRSAAADADRRARSGGDRRSPTESEAYESAHRDIEGLEADVEAARSEVFSAINSATALRHALEHAAAARDRVAETLSKLDVETDDVRIESERVAADRGSGRRRPAPRAGGNRGDAPRTGGAGIGAGQRAHRARMARARRSVRANTSWPGSRRG